MTNDRQQESPGQKPAGRGRWTAGLAGLLGLATVLVVFQFAGVGDQQVPAKPPPQDRPQEVLGDGYVSSSVCLDCHESQHESWHASYHRTMTQVASPETVIGHFDGRQASADSLRANFNRRGDEFWVEMFPVGGKKLEQPVVMTTGSHHQQAYWMSTGWQRQLSMVPFIYLKEADRWIPRRAVFLKPPGAQADALHKGRWNHTCIACHTTHGIPAISSAGMQTQVAEFGIACEACHGPGENHVRFHGGLAADPSAAGVLEEDDIVNPSTLSHEHNAQICGQCHSTFGDNMAAFSTGGDRYRPGEDLWKTRDHAELQKTEGQFWSDGMVRVSGREFNGLIDSACYQRGTMTCLSCHSMHKGEDDPRPFTDWADDQLRADVAGNQACLQCHEEFSGQEKLTAHTHHAADSSGSLCYNCHMPHTSYGLLKAIRSHQISSPDASVDLTTGRMNACNLCHLNKTLAWTADHLEDWYGIRPPELNEQRQNISAAVLALLTGDAGERALAAWHLGWSPAQQISGTVWMPPQLAVLLEDPYDAVRYIAQRSLRSLPGFEQWSFDFLASPEERAAARQEVNRLWSQSSPPVPDDSKSVLLDSQGNLEREEQQKLLNLRSNRDVFLRE